MTHFPLIISYCPDGPFVVVKAPEQIESGKGFLVHKTRATKQLEKQVRKNALELDTIDLKSHEGELAIYHQGRLLFSDDYMKAYKLAIDTFGDVGFVIRRVGHVAQLSSLVKG